MPATPITGRVHSIQTLGTLDGPGVRFVIFVQGCPLRCGCCHNPDTWEFDGGSSMTVDELVARALRYRSYFGTTGGVTASGGEPLLQSAFVGALFQSCHQNGLNTCLDTSGCLYSPEVDTLLDATDRVLLDIKYPTDELYRTYVGCGIDAPLRFLRILNEKRIPVTLRQVIIPSLNDNATSMDFLADLVTTYPCVDQTELLPFRKLCTVKYDNLNLPFRFGNLPEATSEQINRLQAELSDAIASKTAAGKQQ